MIHLLLFSFLRLVSFGNLLSRSNWLDGSLWWLVVLMQFDLCEALVLEESGLCGADPVSVGVLGAEVECRLLVMRSDHHVIISLIDNQLRTILINGTLLQLKLCLFLGYLLSFAILHAHLSGLVDRTLVATIARRL